MPNLPGYGEQDFTRGRPQPLYLMDVCPSLRDGARGGSRICRAPVRAGIIAESALIPLPVVAPAYLVGGASGLYARLLSRFPLQSSAPKTQLE